jgi:hypothetical protein
LLYNLVIEANVEVIETKVQREREYILLLGYLSAEMRGRATKDRVQTLRLAVLMFLESVIILDSAIAQLAADRLNGQPVSGVNSRKNAEQVAEIFLFIRVAQ